MKAYHLIPVIIWFFIISEQLTSINNSIKQLQINAVQDMKK